MSESDTSDDTSETTEDSTANQGQNIHVIFVDGGGEDDKQTYEDDVVDSATIIERAGYDDPDQYILEALRGQSDNVEEQFDPQDEAGPAEVNLTDQHRKHFRVTTRGQVFI
jgi:hypothetical protein